MTHESETPNTAPAICSVCGGEYPIERQEAGYDYCIQAECISKGFNPPTIELEVNVTESRF